MGERRFYHGGDYNPEQWLKMPEILNKDLELMEKARVNIVTLGVFSWSMLEPEEGKYDLDWLADIIDKLYARGISVDLATPSAAKPAWLAQKYPEVLRVGANRVREKYGNRHSHCYTSPVYREKVRAVDQALARRFGAHPGVVMWHISNELGGECHCELCQNAFREWLRGRYGSLDKLNEAWNSAFWSHIYSDWSQIESPAPHGEGAMHGLILDWKRFVTQRTLDFYRMERDAVRELVPGAKFTVNMMYRFDGLDYYKFAPGLDMISWDDYPTWHKAGESDEEIALKSSMMHDFFYSLKGQPFWMMESSPSMTNWQPVSKVKKPGVQMLSGLNAVAHGADAVMYFQWRQSRGAVEKFHGAVVGHDGREDSRPFRETAELGKVLEMLAPIAGALRAKEAAIVYDVESKWAMEGAQGPRNIGLGYWDEVMLHYRALQKRAVTVDFVNEDGDISGYKLVVCPMLYMLREDFCEKLRAFVAGGGTLVLTYWSGVADETDLCRLGDTPYGLTDVLGLRRLEIDGMYDGETRRCVPVSAENAPEAYGSVLCEVAEVSTAKPLYIYAEDFFKGAPAAAVNFFGNGRTYYLATRFEPGFYSELYAKLAADLFDSPIKQPLPEGVLPAKRGDWLFVQNTTGEEAEAMDAKLPPYGTLILNLKMGERLIY